MNGFALGGALEGFNQSRQLGIQQQKVDQEADFRTKELAIQQQQLANAQQRDLLARADKERQNLMTVAGETIKELKLRGISNDKIAQAVQPLVQAAKRLAKSSGMDDSAIDAQVAASLAQPSVDTTAVTGQPTQPAQPAQPTGQPVQPGQSKNITGPGVEVTGVDYGPVTTNNQPPQDDVNRLTTALMQLPSWAPASMRDALTLRLQDAIKQKNENVEVKVLKDENDNQHIVFVDKKNKTVQDQNGNAYVAPTGKSSDADEIAKAIAEGKQSPVLTGLYRHGKAVRAALARQGVDLSQLQLDWAAAYKQVQSLNGPQMVRYAGLAKSVVNTIDEVLRLSKEMQNSGITGLNAVRLQALVNTAGNTKQGQLATRYLASINTLKEEFANLANGGYAPTEPAWALANQQINANYGVDQLAASLPEIQRLLRYRLKGIPNFQTLGPGASNRYIAGQPDQGGHAKLPPPPPGNWVDVTPGHQ